MERGRIQGLPKFLEYPLLSQERVKLRTSNFVCTFLVSIGTKVHYKFLVLFCCKSAIILYGTPLNFEQTKLYLPAV